MEKIKNILSIAKTESIRKDLDVSHIIVISFKEGITTVATAGKDALCCEQAAVGGNWLKENFLHWPTEMCKAESSSVLKLNKVIEKQKKKIKELQAELDLVKGFKNGQ